MLKLYVILLFIVPIYGCAGIGITNKKIVDNNVFYSSLHPRLKVVVSNEFEYIGMLKKNKHYQSTGNDVILKRYVFAKYDNDRRIKSAVQILTKDISPGYWLSDIFGHVDKDKVILNRINDIDGKKYNTIIEVTKVGNVDFYNDKGFITSKNCFARGIAKTFGTKSQNQFMVWYWEDQGEFNKILKNKLGYTFSTVPKFNNLDTKELKVIRNFIDRSNKAYKVENLSQDDQLIFENNNHTSNETAPNKLIELKKLRDQGIINEEDYNLKKQEILKDF